MWMLPEKFTTNMHSVLKPWYVIRDVHIKLDKDFDRVPSAIMNK